MSSTILGGDFTVYYEVEDRQKRIEYTGSGTTYTVNELYSALQDLFDELSQLDDGVPMSAQTPVEYTIGIIDSGDDDPWFIDQTSVQYLTGGAIQTNGWKRVTGSNTGIIRLPMSSMGTIVVGDIGETCSHGDGDSGTVLDINMTTKEIWIRPDDDTAGNDWDVSGGTLTLSGAHTGTPDSGSGTSGARTGEMLWANIYSLGSFADNTRLYVYQDEIKLTEYRTANQWWEEDNSGTGDPNFDILVPIKEPGLTDSSLIDEGYITVFARQFSQTYDYYQVDLSAGGRNPIPLATGVDTNNDGSLRSTVCSGGSGTWEVGEVFGDNVVRASATERAVVVAVDNNGTATPTIYYYLISDLDDFEGSESIEGYSSGATATSGAPSNSDIGALSGLSVVHASDETTYDIDEDGTKEKYSIVVDCSDEAIQDVYEWLKSLTKRGETGIENTDDMPAESYIGNEIAITYTTLSSGTMDEGAIVKQQVTGAVGTIVAHHTTGKILILRNTRGTFDSTNQIHDEDSTDYVSGPLTLRTTTPIKPNPFGTFAGGIFFAGPGVVFANVKSGDENSYVLLDDEGNTVQVPTKVTVTVGNTRVGDRVACFRLDGVGGNIEKNTYTSHNTNNSQWDTTLEVTASIDPEEPGKATGGVLIIVGDDENDEYRIPYASYSGAIFTLARAAGPDLTEAGGNGTSTTKITATGAFASSVIGDMIINDDRGDAVSYITEIVDANEVNIYPPITGQVSGDTFYINSVPFTMDNNDNVYVPFIHAYEDTGDDGSPGSEGAQVVYSIDIPVVVRVRQAGDITPFEQESKIESTGMTINTIRTPDAIYT
jgi:hypothetical protein